MKLTLLVKNTDELAGVSQSSYAFNEEGGTAGSSEQNNWTLQSNSGQVEDSHFAINLEDGHFSLSSLSGGDIFINHSVSSLDAGQRVAITDGDFIRVGGLEIDAIIEEDASNKSHLKNITRTTAIEEFVHGSLDDQENANYQEDLTKSWPSTGEIKRYTPQPKDRNVDPLDAFPVNDSHLQNEQNPLVAMDRLSSVEASKDKSVLDDLEKSFIQEDQASAADLTDAGGASMILPKANRANEGETYMDDLSQKDIDRLETAYGTGGFDAADMKEEDINHVVLRPLTKSMGLELSDFPLAKHQEMMDEIGRSIREAVNGLTEIYAKRQGKAHRFPLAQIALQPIEDNPVRLLDSSDEVMRALFVDHSPVHLSAPEAIHESLNHLHHHQNATEAAIDAGLESILDAFDPNVLMARFKKYARYKEIPENEQDAWAWKMYCLYHKELSSHRQQGLQLLFWDIFGQVYDRIMRENVDEST